MSLWRLLYYFFMASLAFSSCIKMSSRTSSILLAMATASLELLSLGGVGLIWNYGLKYNMASTGDLLINH
jgi:hypothetical protein